MIKFSSSFKLNEIHTVDSTFNEDTKNINVFFQEGPYFGVGMAGRFWEIGSSRDIYYYATTTTIIIIILIYIYTG